MMEEHWNKIYKRTAFDQLGWHENNPEPSLELIKDCSLNKDAVLLNVGAGTTTLIDHLLDMGYENILINDISSTAIDNLRSRLSNEQLNKTRWIIDDLINPDKLQDFGFVDLWHDRAVLHFFNDPKEQIKYFNLLKKLVRKGGFVIIAAFNLNGAEKCSGLPVFRYDKAMLQEKMGDEFTLLRTLDYTYIMPSGNSREYIYTLFKRRI
ncbi:MAG: class I SAM-dependent methyltransferase [Bacteroidetes bacterium]|nr:class I SAM-dependent methyltransferase [Bacteroidota bacterium]